MRGDHQNTTEPNREEYVNFFMTQAKFFDTLPPPTSGEGLGPKKRATYTCSKVASTVLTSL